MKLAKRVLLLTLILTLSFSLLVYAETVKVTILHTNDMHGRLTGVSGDEGEVGSFARIYTLIQKIKSQEDNVMVLDAGDTLHGTNLVNLEKGLNAAALLQLMGYEAMVPGNHDFNYGYERLKLYSKVTKFPIISANVDKDGGLLFKPYIILKKGGYKFGVIGISTPDTPITTHPANVVGLDFVDPVTKLKEVVKEIDGQVDFIVVLSHAGYELDKVISREVPEVDIIVGGHSHTEVKESDSRAIIVQTGEYGKYLGKLDLIIDDGKITDYNIDLVSVVQDIEKNVVVNTLVNLYQTRLDDKLNQVVGSSGVGLVGERAKVRTQETNLGNLIVDVMLANCDADIAVTNGGGIRSALPAGDITIGDIYTVLPFDNTLVVLELTGAQIKEALEHSVRLYPSQNGGFLHVAGMTFTFDANKPAGERVENVLINGETLNMNKVYRVATNDFLAVGGDGYAMFKEGTIVYESGIYLRDMMVDYLRAEGEISPVVEGRIVVK